MNDINKLDIQIVNSRKNLDLLVNKDKIELTKEVVELSQELDRLINFWLEINNKRIKKP